MQRDRSSANLHRGQAYHEFMLASARDRKVRERFQHFVCRVMPPHGAVLDFGAGTGIDAKWYAARGFKTFVHEPCEENLDCLITHCREEIANGAITITDLSSNIDVRMIAANFAVLNLIDDHRGLFQKFAGLAAPGGFVLISLLNPFFLGDARYAWWRKNLRPLVKTGKYAVEGKSGPIYRFAPSAIISAAAPDFHCVACVPRGLRAAASRYIFMLFRNH